MDMEKAAEAAAMLEVAAKMTTPDTHTTIMALSIALAVVARKSKMDHASNADVAKGLGEGLASIMDQIDAQDTMNAHMEAHGYVPVAGNSSVN